MNAAELFARANALFGQRRPGEAEALYRQAVQLQPGFAEAWLNLGVTLKSLGRLGEAEASYRQALHARPQLVEALNNLANVLDAQGRQGEAEGFYRQALALRPTHLEAWINLSRILLASGRAAEAELCSRRAIELRPELPEPHNSLGLALKSLGRLDAAEACFRQALACRPDYADGFNNLGNLRQGEGDFAAAEVLYRQALAIRPAYPEALNNLGNTLLELGRYSEAEACYRQALGLFPGYVEAHGHLGAALKAQGRLDEASAAYRRLLELRPGDVVGLNNLAQLLVAQGDAGSALGLIMQALERADGAESRLLFMDCITRLRITHIDEAIRQTMLRALTVPWGQASSLGRVGAELVKLRLRAGGAADALERGTAFSDSGMAERFGAIAVPAAASDELFSALLAATQLRDPELEQFLTVARSCLLASAQNCVTGALPPEQLRFYTALARQCFINEYVYFSSDQEAALAESLRQSVDADLAAGRPVAPLALIAVAAYFPLHTLAAAGCLLDADWPEALAGLIGQQVREPWRERELAASIPDLTPIDDAVSLKVQEQYSENPYPRWMSADIAVPPKGVNQFIRGCMPRAEFTPLQIDGRLELLVAGCGTGLQPIGAARRFREVSVLAVDLSLPSLCYARRKAEEMGVTNIAFAQADLLRLGNIGRTFDVIESAGVLHHLSSIESGLAVLVPLLRSGGLMQLGLYSQIARRDISRARAYIAERGVGSDARAIRRCRHELIALGPDHELAPVTRLSDFFGTSTCRDLLFHVQEICNNLLQLKALLSTAGLRFLGFDIDPQVQNAYRQRFPSDPAATNLEQWHQFELEHPDTFIGMYQFWAQKIA